MTLIAPTPSAPTTGKRHRGSVGRYLEEFNLETAVDRFASLCQAA